ncbi:Vitamin B12-dependent ribonucleotide reductase, partial [termite gut metagenome]
LMVSMGIRHENVENFVTSKLENGKYSGANISVRLDDEWLNAALYDKSKEEKHLWDKIIHSAWKCADPGLLFWDTIIRESVADCYKDFGFETVTTNPCGEIPLSPYDSCRLLLLNLYSYVVNPFTNSAYFDRELFRKHCKIAVKIMDNR